MADPSRKLMTWQEGENGPVTFQVQNMMFWGVDGSHSTGSWPRCVGTLPPGETPIWCGGKQGTMSENGLVTFQVQNMIFWVAQPGVPVYRQQGTMSDWSAGGWHCIGTLGTKARDANYPQI